MDEQVTIDQLLEASAGRTADELMTELAASGAADKLGDLDAFSAMLARAGSDADYAATICALGQADAEPLLAPPS